MARTRSRKLSAWNKAVKKAFAKGAASFQEAVATAKKSYKSGSRSSATKVKRCPKGSHRRIRGRGSRCVKN